MCPIESGECESKSQGIPDARQLAIDENSDGDFCCPECGTRLRHVDNGSVVRADSSIPADRQSTIDAIASPRLTAQDGDPPKLIGEAPDPNARRSSDPPGSRNHSGFFGVLSNLGVDWGNPDGGVPSTVGCGLDSRATPNNDVEDADYDPIDIDWLLDPSVLLVSQDSFEKHEQDPGQLVDSDSDQHEQRPLVESNSETPDSTANLSSAADAPRLDSDISIVFEERSTALSAPTNVASDSCGTDPVRLPVGCTAEKPDLLFRPIQRQLRSDVPVARDISVEPRRRPVHRQMGLGLGVALAGAFALMALYPSRTTDASMPGSPLAPALDVAAPTMPEEQTMPLGDVTTLDTALVEPTRLDIAFQEPNLNQCSKLRPDPAEPPASLAAIEGSALR